MIRMIIVFLLGVVMFGGSAAVSWYLRRAESSREAEQALADAKDRGREKVGVPGEQAAKLTPGFVPKSPVALDPAAAPLARPTPPSAESLAQAAAGIRQQQESLKSREQVMQTRVKHLEIINEDLRKERKTMDDLRFQIQEEMKTLTEKIDSLERKAGELDKKKAEVGKQTLEAKQALVEVDTVEQKNIKKMAETFNAMEPDTASELLQQMADGGKMDMAVKILSSMQERQAARVLSKMEDRSAAVQLLDKMKGLKRPGPVTN